MLERKYSSNYLNKFLTISNDSSAPTSMNSDKRQNDERNPVKYNFKEIPPLKSIDLSTMNTIKHYLPRSLSKSSLLGTINSKNNENSNKGQCLNQFKTKISLSKNFSKSTKHGGKENKSPPNFIKNSFVIKQQSKDFFALSPKSKITSPNLAIQKKNQINHFNPIKSNSKISQTPGKVQILKNHHEASGNKNKSLHKSVPVLKLSTLHQETPKKAEKIQKNLNKEMVIRRNVELRTVKSFTDVKLPKKQNLLLIRNQSDHKILVKGVEKEENILKIEENQITLSNNKESRVSNSKSQDPIFIKNKYKNLVEKFC